MSKRKHFKNVNKNVWFTYVPETLPASLHVIFANELTNDSESEPAFKLSFAPARRLLRLDATKQALKNCKVERVLFVGEFATDPCKDHHQHVFTNTHLWDVLRNVSLNPKAKIAELEFEFLGMVKGASSGPLAMTDILSSCSTFIAEDILDYEAEYYAKQDTIYLPGDYEEVLDNMENMNKDELLNASKIVAGKITNENFKAFMDNFAFSGDITWKNEDFFKKLQKESFENAKPLNKDIPDPVNHPQHYKSSNGLEAIDCIEAFTEGLPGDLGYCVGNAIKYLCRFNKKSKPIEDLEKAKWYVNRAIENVKKREE